LRSGSEEKQEPDDGERGRIRTCDPCLKRASTSMVPRCACLCLHVLADIRNLRHRQKQALTGHVYGHVFRRSAVSARLRRSRHQVWRGAFRQVFAGIRNVERRRNSCFFSPIRSGSILGCFRRQSCLDLYEVVSNRVHDQIPDGVKAQFPHEIDAVRFDGLGAQVQKSGNFL
jgi:hypothetical protein